MLNQTQPITELLADQSPQIALQQLGLLNPFWPSFGFVSDLPLKKSYLPPEQDNSSSPNAQPKASTGTAEQDQYKYTHFP